MSWPPGKRRRYTFKQPARTCELSESDMHDCHGEVTGQNGSGAELSDSTDSGDFSDGDFSESGDDVGCAHAPETTSNQQPDPFLDIGDKFPPTTGTRASKYGLSQYAWDILCFMQVPPLFFNLLYFIHETKGNTTKDTYLQCIDGFCGTGGIYLRFSAEGHPRVAWDQLMGQDI